MARAVVTRWALEQDERAFVAEIGQGEWDKLLALAKCAKRSGLHMEVDPSTSNVAFVEVHFTRRYPTRQRKDTT